MLNDFENNLNRDVSIKIDGRPNGSLLVVDWCIKHYLDNERHLLNLGAFTGRDLEWMIPICKKYSKQIECIENWHFISSIPLRNKIIQEIGLPLSERVFPEWQKWLNKKIKSKKF